MGVSRGPLRCAGERRPGQRNDRGRAATHRPYQPVDARGVGWIGATRATRMRSSTLYKVLAALLVLIAASLAASHVGTIEPLSLPLPVRIAAGLIAGIGIGIGAALMGVAGGELLIPTIVLLFAVDIKTAGSLSLIVSLPTMLVAFARYSRDGSFTSSRPDQPPQQASGPDQAATPGRLR